MTYCNARIKCKEAGLSAPSSSALFQDFHNLQEVWTHPLALKEQRAKMDESVTSDGEQSEDDEGDSHFEDDTSKISNGDSETDADIDSM